MIRSIGKLLSQGLLVLAPMLTQGWSFLNYLGYPGSPTDVVTVNILFLVPLSGEKQQVEMQLRVMASLLGFALIVFYEIIDNLIPRRELDSFRRAYLKQQQKEWRKPKNTKNGIPSDVRINIMHVYYPWYSLPFGRFVWTWNDGFKPNEKDVNLLLMTFQGVAGIAFKTEDPKGIDLRGMPPPRVRFKDYGPYIVLMVLGAMFLTLYWPFSLVTAFWAAVLLVAVLAWEVLTLKGLLKLHPFYLWPRQGRKTERVKYILSIPIFKASKGENPTFKCVGVINLDTTSNEGAAFLAANKGRLAKHFDEAGLIIACLR